MLIFLKRIFMKKNFDTQFITKLLNKENHESGLYVVATPLGNLGDITIRGLNILSSSDLVLCEDTRISKRLTSKYGIKCTMKSFHKYNSKKLIEGVILSLKSGKVISLISDAGTPLISDPGSDLVSACVMENIKVYSIPGPSAVIASLVTSGISTEQFTFLGFFPRNNRKKKIFLEQISSSSETIILFESPKRILKTINELRNFLNDRKISVVRELTKKNEEVITGSFSYVYNQLYEKEKILGEITLIIEMNIQKNEINISDRMILNFANKLKLNKLTISDASKKIADEFGISKRRVYQLIIKNKIEI